MKRKLKISFIIGIILSVFTISVYSNSLVETKEVTINGSTYSSRSQVPSTYSYAYDGFTGILPLENSNRIESRIIGYGTMTVPVTRTRTGSFTHVVIDHTWACKTYGENGGDSDNYPSSSSVWRTNYVNTVPMVQTPICGGTCARYQASYQYTESYTTYETVTDYSDPIYGYYGVYKGTVTLYRPKAVPALTTDRFEKDTVLNSTYIRDNSFINLGPGRTDTITQRTWTLKYPNGATTQSTSAIPSFTLNQQSITAGDYKLTLEVRTSPYNIPSTNADNYVTFTVGPKLSMAAPIDISIFNDGKGSNDKLTVNNITTTSALDCSSLELRLIEATSTLKKSYTLSKVSSTTGSAILTTKWSNVVNSDLGFNLDKTKSYKIDVIVKYNNSLGNPVSNTFSYPVVAQDTDIIQTSPTTASISNCSKIVDMGTNITLDSYTNTNAQSVTITADRPIFKVGSSLTDTITITTSTTTGGYKKFSRSVQIATSGNYGPEKNNNILTFKAIDSSGRCINVEENRIRVNWYFSGNLLVKAVRDIAWKDEYLKGTVWSVGGAGSLKLPIQYKPSSPQINAPIKLGYGVDFNINTVQAPLDANTKLVVDVTYFKGSTNITNQIYDATLPNKPILGSKYKKVEILGNSSNGSSNYFSTKVVSNPSVGANGATWSFMYYLPAKLCYSNGTPLSGDLKVNFNIKLYRDGVEICSYNDIALAKDNWNGDAFIYTTDATSLSDIGGQTTH